MIDFLVKINNVLKVKSFLEMRAVVLKGGGVFMSRLMFFWGGGVFFR